MKDRKIRAAEKTLIDKFEQEFKRQVDDLSNILIDKLFNLINGKASQGVKNYLNDDVRCQRDKIFFEDSARD
jgi:DNA-directed RNA polymerase subunit beta